MSIHLLKDILVASKFGFEFEIKKWLQYRLSNVELAAGIAKECKRIKNKITLQHVKRKYEINKYCYVYYVNHSNEIDLFIDSNVDWMQFINKIKMVMIFKEILHKI